MVAVAAVLEHAPSGRVLLLQRSAKADFAAGVWEDLSGRMHAAEEPIEALRREIREETGIEQVTIVQPIRVYHFYRGPAEPEYEVVGVAFWCQTDSDDVRLSAEHDAYRWLDPDEAVELAGTDGIRRGIEAFQGARSSQPPRT